MSQKILIPAFVAVCFLSGCSGFLHNINPGNEIMRIQNAANSERIREGRFPVNLNPKTWVYLNWYTRGGRNELKTIIERSWYWIPMMKMVFKSENLPEELIYLPVIESEFITSAISSKRASGPWQFMAGTGRLYGLSSDWWFDERRDPEKSTRAAALHLKLLFRMFNDWQIALAAYNAGDGNISRAIRKTKTRDFQKLCRIRKAIPKETQHYVPKFTAAAAVIDHMAEFGFTNLATCDPLYYDSVRLPDSTDLEVVAKCCLTNVKSIRLLNCELKQWATPPVTNYVIKIPYGRKQVFESNFARIPPEERITFRRYRIRPGDTVSGIAYRYGVPQDIILSFNKLGNTGIIVADQYLIIPLRGTKTTTPGSEESTGGTAEENPKIRQKPATSRQTPSDARPGMKPQTDARNPEPDPKSETRRLTPSDQKKRKFLGLF